MIPISAHSHSGQFCKHASGTLEEVVVEAIAQKFRFYGLSEHIPRQLQSQLYQEETDLGMQPSDLFNLFNDFLVEASRLKTKYQNDITLAVSLETEWVEHSLAIIRDLQLRKEIEYIVGSVHHVFETPIDYSYQLFQDLVDKHGLEAVHLAYFEAQYQMIVEIHPEVIAHFDLIMIWSTETLYTPAVLQLINRNIEFICSYGGLFELNARGFNKTCGVYPRKDLVTMMQRNNAHFTVSDDSHGVLDVGKNYDRMMAYIRECGNLVFNTGIENVYWPSAKNLNDVLINI